MNRAGASKLYDTLPESRQLQQGTINDFVEIRLRRRQRGVDDDVEREYQDWLAAQWSDHVASLRDDPITVPHEDQAAFSVDETVLRKNSKITLGYVTKDACPGIGDDILHEPGELVSPIYLPLTLLMSAVPLFPDQP